MPRRIRDYLDRLSHRDTHREEPNTYTVNTTVNLNDWQPTRWNATQWFPDNEDTPARAHDMDVSGLTRQMLENTYNHMTARDVMEMAEEATPERMLRLVRLAMPNITRNTLVEETPMEVLENDLTRDWGAEAISRATRIPTSYFSANEEMEYKEYTPSWGNRTSHSGCKLVYKNGKLKVIKRYCKI